VLKINEGSVFNFRATNKKAAASEPIAGKWSIFRGACKPEHPVKGQSCSLNKTGDHSGARAEVEELGVHALRTSSIHIRANGATFNGKCVLV
jgi:hypothetical protein